MEKNPLNINIEVGDLKARVHGCIYQRVTNNPPRRLVMLHGAGVAGELTWTYFANYLTEWDELLIIDFPGMGASEWGVDLEWPSIGQYSQVVQQLLIQLDWLDVDICGYSFGGVVAAVLSGQLELTGINKPQITCHYLILLEPAMLFSTASHDLLQRGREYTELAERIAADPKSSEPFRQFMNAVSPHREKNAAVDRLGIKRLMQRPIGFAQAIHAVSQLLMDHAEYLHTWCPNLPGQSFIGQLSPKHLVKRHHRLLTDSAVCKDQWSVEIIDKADHSLVFSRPRIISRHMNEHHRHIFSVDT